MRCGALLILMVCAYIHNVQLVRKKWEQQEVPLM